MTGRNAAVTAALAALLLAGAASGEEGYVDTARVVHVEPVAVTRTVPNLTCRADASGENERHRSTAGLGDVRADDASLGLGTVLRTAAADRPAARCPPVTERRVVGYEVTLRYGAEQWTTRMSRDPGDRVRVRVSFEPSSAHARAGR